MSDPFALNSHNQLIREAQRGLAIFAILLAVLGYVVFDRLSGRSRQLPEHVRNAPIAQTVWPYANEAPDSASRHAARQRARKLEPANELAGRSDSAEPNHLQADSFSQVEPAEYHDTPNHSDFVKEQASRPLRQTKPSALSASSARDFAPLRGDPTPPLTKDQPFPHTSALIPESPPIKDSNFGPELESTQPKQQIASQFNSDFPLDPFESSVTNDAKVPSNPVANQKEALVTTPVSHFSLPPSQSQSTAVPSSRSSSTQVSAAINALDACQPTLLAPSPKDLPEDDLAAKPSSFIDRTSNPQTLSSFPVASTLDKPSGLLVPATQGQVGNPRQSTLHVVAKGESYYSIAQHYYGNGDYFRALWQFNRFKRQVGEELSVGTEIEIPTTRQLQDEFPNDAPRSPGFPVPPSASTFVSALNSGSIGTQMEPLPNSKQSFSLTELADNDEASTSSHEATAETNYITKQGETLFEIAANELGQASRYLDILEANRGRLPENVSDSTPLPANLTLVIPK